MLKTHGCQEREEKEKNPTPGGKAELCTEFVTITKKKKRSKRMKRTISMNFLDTVVANTLS